MKKLISLCLCAALALALLCLPAAAYLDVAEDAWYAAAAAYCQENGLMEGLPGDVFEPQGAVTRAQLVTALWRLAGKPAVGSASGFADVPEGEWYDVAVRWAKRTGVTSGMGDGTFAPDAPLTREMLVTFFHRFAGSPAAEGEDFADQADISDWAQLPARWAAGVGLMQGRGGGIFDPRGGAVRAELAQVLMNYEKRVGTKPFIRVEMDESCTPVGVALGSDGAMYVADEFNKAVWRVTPEGSERVAGAVSVADENGIPIGGYADGPANEALFGSPWGIAPFLGGFAVSDPANNTVRLLRDGRVETLNGIAFSEPTGLAADGDGNLFVANTAAGTVMKVSPEGRAAVVAQNLTGPTGLAWSGGTLYIAETDADRILALSESGTRVLAGSGERGDVDGAAAEAAFAGPQGLAVGPDGTVYVSDTANGAVRCIRGGAVTTLLVRADWRGEENWPVSPMGLVLSGDALTVCDRFVRKLFTVTAG